MPRPEPPVELRDASKITRGYKPATRTPYRNCHRLIIHGEQGDYTWGFRIYRTSYSEPNVDAEFNKAIDILRPYMREDIFYDFEHHRQPWGRKDPNVKDDLDNAPEQQLWKRLRNEIVENQEALLEDASPAKLSEMHHEWLESRGGKTMQDCRNRYFLILDDEIIDNLLILPPPDGHISPTICMKVFDAKFGLPSSYFGNEFEGLEDSDDDEDEEGYSSDDNDYEGWFWTSAESLKDIWLQDSRKERRFEVYVWDEE